MNPTSYPPVRSSGFRSDSGRTPAPLPKVDPEALIRSLVVRGLRLFEDGKYAEVEALCLKVLGMNVHHADALYLLGMVGFKTERYTMAERMIRRAIAANDSQPWFHANLGNTLVAQTKIDEGIQEFQRALELDPNHPEAHFNLGNAYATLKEYPKAEACFRKNLENYPLHLDSRFNLANTLRLLDRREEAMESYRHLLTIHPDHADTHCSYGSALHEIWKIDEAVAHYKRALELNPKHFKAANCLANGCFDQGKLEESVAACELAVSLKEDFYDAQMNQSLLQLLRGDYVNGWRNYEVRWKVYEPRVPNIPPWDGSPLNGQSILLHSEQGLGDSLQFLRYVPMVQAAGGRVMLDMQDRLRRLVATMPDLISLTDTGAPVPIFQNHSPMMSLPHAFGTTVETIPANVPYLTVPQDALDKAAARAWPTHGLRVGLCWGGNPSHPKNHSRSLPLQMLEPLFELKDVHFFSLQMGPALDQIAPYREKIVDLAPETEDMADTAAQMENLDLILTIDTSIAHLAGALGRPMWVLTSFVPDWRWLMDREDCPWYPTARLFRQQSVGDWKPVVERVREEMKQLATQCMR